MESGLLEMRRHGLEGIKTRAVVVKEAWLWRPMPSGPAVQELSHLNALSSLQKPQLPFGTSHLKLLSPTSPDHSTTAGAQWQGQVNRIRDPPSAVDKGHCRLPNGSL